MKLKIKKLFFTMFLCFLFIPTFQSVSAMENNNNNNNNNYNILIIGRVQLKNEILARNIGAYLQSAINNRNNKDLFHILKDIEDNDIPTVFPERFPFERCIAALLARRTNNWPLEDEFVEEQISVNCKKFRYTFAYPYNGEDYNINVNIYIVSPIDLNATNEINFLQTVNIHDVAICLQSEDLGFVHRYVNYVTAHVLNHFDNLRLIVPIGELIYCKFRNEIRSIKNLNSIPRVMSMNIDIFRDILDGSILESEYELHGITGYIREIFINLSDLFNMIRR
ncbi:MAG: hypothetical protein Q4B84_00820 [Clostridia bacterium]|nr:hypothetical protein [Clostridia bacterium]